MQRGKGPRAARRARPALQYSFLENPMDRGASQATRASPLRNCLQPPGDRRVRGMAVLVMLGRERGCRLCIRQPLRLLKRKGEEQS